jgi:hypothetical protein
VQKRENRTAPHSLSPHAVALAETKERAETTKRKHEQVKRRERKEKEKRRKNA